MLPPPLPVKLSPWPIRILAIALGLIYGLSVRLVFAGHGYNNTFTMMSVSFLFGVPFVVGFLHTYIGESRGRWSWPERLFTPCIPALLSLLAALILAWEGIICVILWIPIVVVMAILGGLTAALTRDLFRRGGNYAFACCLMLPVVLAPVENRIDPERQIRTVHNEIEIHAPRQVVWDHIKSVEAIRPEEQPPTWTQRIGFPRPIAATLSREGIGGIRRATFQGGVLFYETVNVWEPGSRLAFSIRADPASIPPKTLDEHVTVGGPYFDVLQGEYVIEQIGADRFRLHLSSRHRLSTRFNTYAMLWTDAIMSDVQRNILEILKRRCESGIAQFGSESGS